MLETTVVVVGFLALIGFVSEQLDKHLGEQRGRTGHFFGGTFVSKANENAKVTGFAGYHKTHW